MVSGKVLKEGVCKIAEYVVCKKARVVRERLSQHSATLGLTYDHSVARFDYDQVATRTFPEFFLNIVPIFS